MNATNRHITTARARRAAMSSMISQKRALLFTAVTGFAYGLQFMPELPSACDASTRVGIVPIRELLMHFERVTRAHASSASMRGMSDRYE